MDKGDLGMQFHAVMVGKPVPFKKDFAGVTSQYSGKNIHKSGFAGAILT